MDPFAPMAHQLAARPEPTPAPAQHEGITERIRQDLRDNGQRTARELAALVGLADTGKISAILKKDRREGRVLIIDGFYSWNFGYVAPEPGQPGRPVRLREVLEWHEVADDDFPDADLTVIVRMRNNEEPVWLGFWDGQEWRDTDNQVIDVVRWTDIPKGGAA